MSSLQTAAAEATAAAVVPVPQGPPFTSPWTRFRNPPTDPAGFWSAIRHDVMNGALLLQLGTQAHPITTPPTGGSVYIGYNWAGYLPAGRHNFTVRFRVGPVSLAQNGGHVEALLLAQFFGPHGQLADFVPIPATRTEADWVLRVTSPFDLRAGQYTFRFGIALISNYQRDQKPYGEIIARSSSVTYDGTALAGLQSLEEESGLPALLSDEKSFLFEEVSEEQMLKERRSLLLGV
jgi:hypothetical protein